MKDRHEKLSRKRIREVTRIWVDDDDELSKFCNMNLGSLNQRRYFLVMMEVDKIYDAGLIESKEKLKFILVAEDLELSKLGLEMVYQLREKRLGI